jgi:4-carboxymuconolactone decarboxylase
VSKRPGLLLAALAALTTMAAPAAEPPAGSARRERGLATLDTITGGGTQSLRDSLAGVAPELADWIVDFAYGDVVSRPQLDLRSRELATVAALTALGNAAPQLRAHIKGALNAGCSPREIVEVILQMSVYAGFPAALNGIAAAREVFDEQGVTVGPP